mmetsp:Transcript_23328/g.66417  ORF Transcript_23328/g.66417 Transcript_23328/m.66417 type:complete len:255 (+) Transcript_23328:906-1670(+)
MPNACSMATVISEARSEPMFPAKRMESWASAKAAARNFLCATEFTMVASWAASIISLREKRSFMLTTSKASMACWYGCSRVTSARSSSSCRRAFSKSASELPGDRSLGMTICTRSRKCSSKPMKEMPIPSLAAETEYVRPQVCKASDGSSSTSCTSLACSDAKTLSLTPLMAEGGKPSFTETTALGSLTSPRPSHQSSTRPRSSSRRGPSSPGLGSEMSWSFLGTYWRSGGGTRPWPEAFPKRASSGISIATSS